MEEPLEAELVETKPVQTTGPIATAAPRLPFQPPPRRSLMPILGCGFALFAVLLLACGGVIYALYQAGSELTAGLANQAPPPPEFRLTQETAKITAALDGTWQVAANDPQYREVRRLLRELDKAQSADNSPAFEKLVDWPAHMERFCEAYRYQPINFRERAQLSSMERDDFCMPLEANNFKIAAVDQLTPDDWLVYTYAQDGELTDAAYLFLVRRRDGVWKLVDWAEVAELRWAAEHNGGAAGPSGDFAFDDQQHLIDDVTQADTLRGNGNILGAEALLRQAERRSGVPPQHNSNRYLIALRWHALGNHAETERVLQSVSDPDHFPWVHDLMALTQYERGDYQAALKAIDRFERVAGFYYDMALLRTRCHIALKQKEQAAASALTLVRHRPDNDEALSLALRQMPPGELEKLFALLPAEAESADRLVRYARTVLYDDAVEAHQQLRAYIAKQYPDSSHLPQLDAQLLHYQGELELAVSKLEELIKRETNEEQLRSARGLYLSLLLELGTAAEAYQRAKNPRTTMAAMTEGIAYDEAQISLSQLEKILPLHRQREPEDPKLPWYAAQIAMHKNDWRQAVVELNKAIATLPDGDERESQEEELQHQLLEARYHLGEALDMYQEADDQTEVYQSLAALMEQAGDWSTLRQLNDLHSGGVSDLWWQYYRLRVEEAEARKAQDAGQLTRLLTRYQQLAAANASSKTVFPYMLSGRIENLGIEGSGWRQFVEQHEAPVTLFSRLVARFRRERNEAALAELIALFEQRFPDDNVLVSFDLDRMWEKKDYPAIIARFGSRPIDATNNRNYSLARNIRERLLISYLIQGDTANAWKIASEPTADLEQQWLVRLAEGQPEQIRAFLTEHAEDMYAPLELDEDAQRVPAISKFLQSDEFRRLREEHPPSLGFSHIGTNATLFYPDVTEWTEDSIRERLSKVGLKDVVVLKLPRPPLLSNVFRLTTPTGECFLTCGTEKYVTAADLRTHGGHLDPAFATALAGHRQWIVLELARGLEDQRGESWTKLVAAFTPGANALSGSIAEGGKVQAVMTPELATQLVASPDKLPALLVPLGIANWVPRTVKDEAAEEEERTWYARCRAVDHGNSPGRILVRWTQGEASEDLWLEVISVKHQHWGQYEIVAKLEETSFLNPQFKQGDKVKISPHQIREWKE